MPKELNTIEEIEEILSSETLDQLIGVIENEIVEAKDQPWNLASRDGQREFARDVSSFANLRGGIILVGVHTDKPDVVELDEIKEVRWLPIALSGGSLQRYSP